MITRFGAGLKGFFFCWRNAKVTTFGLLLKGFDYFLWMSYMAEERKKKVRAR